MDEPMLDNDRARVAIGADAVAGVLDLAEVALIKNNIEITRDTTYAELEANAANYTGYAVEVITWGPATRADDGSIEYLGAAGEFRPTASTVQNAIYGWYIRNAGHTDWLWANRFTNGPLPMESTLDAIQLTLRYRPEQQSMIAILS